MIQDCIAFLIIAAAFGTFIYRIISFFNLLGRKTVKSGNCAGCASGCEMKDSHAIMKKKSTKRDPYQFYL